jgi:hypothetical protein
MGKVGGGASGIMHRAGEGAEERKLEGEVVD